jgi:hypothetical protein
MKVMTALIEKVPRGNPASQAYLLLRVGFTVAPILFGLDKFFNWMVDWTNYLAPWVNDIAPGSGQDFMYFSARSKSRLAFWSPWRRGWAPTWSRLGWRASS